MENLNQKFMKEVANIKDPVVFLGVATILKVKLYTDEKDENGKVIPKDFSVLFKEIMSSYDCASRKRKRELLTILKKSNKESINGTGTENTENPVQDQEM